MKTSLQDTLRQGLVAGLIGYATVGIVFGIVDMLQGHSPFYTAAVLGSALFYGVQAPVHAAVAAPYVFAYNGLHLMIFLLFGFVAAWLARAGGATITLPAVHDSWTAAAGAARPPRRAPVAPCRGAPTRPARAPSRRGGRT